VRRSCVAMLTVLFVMGFARVSASQNVEWTVMVYMSARNNLEQEAIENFLQIASIDSTRQVNVVVELGRPRRHHTDAYGPWAGIRRFLVRRSSTPSVSESLMELPPDRIAAGMGSARNLADFIDWSKARYPARRYMLIIWNHGQGWRLQLADQRSAPGAGVKVPVDDPRPSQVPIPPGGFRSVSFDQESGDFLFNSEIQDVISSRRVDVIGFDACLMAMIETAYAMREGANYLVASQELEPAAGWPYDVWLKELVAKPSMSPPELAAVIVRAYETRYGDIYKTTLSAIDLRQVARLASELTTFSETVSLNIATHAALLNKVRRTIRAYGEAYRLKTSIDLALFLDRFAAQGSDSVRDSAMRVRAAINQVILVNYSSKRMRGDYGSSGLAIYFPATRRDFEADEPDGKGYRVENRDHPVEFVQKEAWSRLLHAYFAYN
jgi:hypothetical protein